MSADEQVDTRSLSLTVEQVKKYDLCRGCGTCAGICPKDAIRMEIGSRGTYLPIIDGEKCNECGLCLQVCPGYSLDFHKLNEFVFDRAIDGTLGNYIACYLGHSANKEIRWRSASGGIVTSILIFALKNKLIDGALVTRMSKENPLEPEVTIARTKEEVTAALGSKYCPVPANVALKDILKEEGTFAVVGLPCHILGIRKAEMLDDRLKSKIVLHIGLFCSHICSFSATELLLRKRGIRKEDVVSMNYRGKGWPGEIWVKLRNGRERTLSRPYSRYWDGLCLTPFFTPMPCALCPDVTCELSDFSCGDAWLPELKGDRMGTSIIISRTENGERVLHLARSKGILEITQTSPKKVEQSQVLGMKLKKKVLGRIISLAELFGRVTPRINPKPSSSGVASYLVAAVIYFGIYLGSKKKFISLLRYVPRPLLKTYFRIIFVTSLLC